MPCALRLLERTRGQIISDRTPHLHRRQTIGLQNWLLCSPRHRNLTRSAREDSRILVSVMLLSERLKRKQGPSQLNMEGRVILFMGLTARQANWILVRGYGEGGAGMKRTRRVRWRTLLRSKVPVGMALSLVNGGRLRSHFLKLCGSSGHDSHLSVDNSSHSALCKVACIPIPQPLVLVLVRTIKCRTRAQSRIVQGTP